jgi:hypothetical protein
MRHVILTGLMIAAIGGSLLVAGELEGPLAKQERAVVNFDQQVEAYEQTARQFEDEIYAVCRPKPLRVRIEPVASDDRRAEK